MSQAETRIGEVEHHAREPDRAHTSDQQPGGTCLRALRQARGGHGVTATDHTGRAALDVLAHGLRGDLADSKVGVELGAMLQTGTAADITQGATPGEVLRALRAAADQQPVVYARLLELIVLAGLHEAQLIAALSDSDLAPTEHDPPLAPPPRPPRRPRR